MSTSLVSQEARVLTHAYLSYPLSTNLAAKRRAEHPPCYVLCIREITNRNPGTPGLKGPTMLTEPPATNHRQPEPKPRPFAPCPAQPSRSTRDSAIFLSSPSAFCPMPYALNSQQNKPISKSRINSAMETTYMKFYTERNTPKQTHLQPISTHPKPICAYQNRNARAPSARRPSKVKSI